MPSPGQAWAGYGGTLRQVGEDITQELDYIFGHFVVRRLIRPRMACTCCEDFAQAPLPSRLIERGRPGPGLVAHMLVGKYCDHLPLDRRSKIYAHEGVDLHHPPCAWYQFSIDRKGEHPSSHLAGYTGTVHADGFAGFNGLFGKGKADEQACLVHVRRKFVDEVERTGSPIAQQAIKQIAELCVVEKEPPVKLPEEVCGPAAGQSQAGF